MRWGCTVGSASFSVAFDVRCPPRTAHLVIAPHPPTSAPIPRTMHAAGIFRAAEPGRSPCGMAVRMDISHAVDNGGQSRYMYGPAVHKLVFSSAAATKASAPSHLQLPSHTPIVVAAAHPQGGCYGCSIMPAIRCRCRRRSSAATRLWCGRGCQS